MAFTPEQAEEVKKQLLVEIDKLPNENKEQRMVSSAILPQIRHMDQ